MAFALAFASPIFRALRALCGSFLFRYFLAQRLNHKIQGYRQLLERIERRLRPHTSIALKPLNGLHRRSLLFLK